MTGREPCLQFSALDLDDALELYVLELSAVAGGIHDGLGRLQKRRDFGHGEEAVVRDGAVQCFSDEGLRQSGVSKRRAFRCIC